MRRKRVKVPEKYESKGGDEFARFDKLMRGLLAVPYQELQKELEKDKRNKERKKRAAKPASPASGDS
jgi:hypothetical protein